VDDAERVRVGQCGQHLPGEVEGERRLERAGAPQQLRQVAAGDVLRRQVEAVVDPAVAEHLDHVRRGHARQDARLALEPLRELGVAGEGRVEHLQGHRTVEADLGGAEHDSHAPAAQVGFDQEVTEALSRLREADHGWSFPAWCGVGSSLASGPGGHLPRAG
jgi:hypothetical protein